MSFKFAVADNGTAIFDGKTVTPCEVAVTEALCDFMGQVTIADLEIKYPGLFSYLGWYSNLQALLVKGLVTKEETRYRHSKAKRILWKPTEEVREIFRLLHEQLN